MPPQGTGETTIKRGLIILCALALAIMACGSGGGNSTSTPESLAFTACTMFVEDQLRVDRSDAQRYQPELVERKARSSATITVTSSCSIWC